LINRISYRVGYSIEKSSVTLELIVMKWLIDVQCLSSLILLTRKQMMDFVSKDYVLSNNPADWLAKKAIEIYTQNNSNSSVVTIRLY
jgi:hypothetical protein